MLLAGSPKANSPIVKIQTNMIQKTSMKKRTKKTVTLPGTGKLVPTTGARPVGRIFQRAPGGWVAHRTWSGSTQKGDVEGPCGPTTCKIQSRGLIQCLPSSRQEGALWASQSLAMEPSSWFLKHQFTEGKEPELLREDERYQLDIDGLTSTHSIGS